MSVEFVTWFLKRFSCPGSDFVRVVRTQLAWEVVLSRFLVCHIYILHTYYRSVKGVREVFFKIAENAMLQGFSGDYNL
jgi:hypothetical protein